MVMLYPRKKVMIPNATIIGDTSNATR